MSLSCGRREIQPCDDCSFAHIFEKTDTGKESASGLSLLLCLLIFHIFRTMNYFQDPKGLVLDTGMQN